MLLVPEHPDRGRIECHQDVVAGLLECDVDVVRQPRLLPRDLRVAEREHPDLTVLRNGRDPCTSEGMILVDERAAVLAEPILRRGHRDGRMADQADRDVVLPERMKHARP